ncbi:MAG: hypothetical protein IJ574_02260 [Bacilli bacterium]|nr:hypothetical protein [Bacilli bacterium]
MIDSYLIEYINELKNKKDVNDIIKTIEKILDKKSINNLDKYSKEALSLSMEKMIVTYIEKSCILANSLSYWERLKNIAPIMDNNPNLLKRYIYPFLHNRIEVSNSKNIDEINNFYNSKINDVILKEKLSKEKLEEFKNKINELIHKQMKVLNSKTGKQIATASIAATLGISAVSAIAKGDNGLDTEDIIIEETIEPQDEVITDFIIEDTTEPATVEETTTELTTTTTTKQITEASTEEIKQNINDIDIGDLITNTGKLTYYNSDNNIMEGGPKDRYEKLLEDGKVAIKHHQVFDDDGNLLYEYSWLNDHSVIYIDAYYLDNNGNKIRTDNYGNNNFFYVCDNGGGLDDYQVDIWVDASANELNYGKYGSYDIDTDNPKSTKAYVNIYLVAENVSWDEYVAHFRDKTKEEVYNYLQAKTR